MDRHCFENRKMFERTALFGDYRYCNDIAYVFHHVFGSYFGNVFYREKEKRIEEICHELKELSKRYNLVIVCVSESDWKRLKNILPEGIVWMEEMFELLDQVNVGWFDRNLFTDKYRSIPENKKLVLWGLNDACTFFLKYQKNLIPDCIVDRDLSKNGKYCNIPIVAPDDIEKWCDYYVIIMCRDKYAVRDWLIVRGLRETEDFVFYGYYVDQLCVSEMLRKTIYDSSKRKINCELPFGWATFGREGELNLCCCARMLAGNILHQNMTDVWKSVAAVIIRLSMINQTYTFCEGELCQFYPINYLENDIEPPKNAYNKEALVNPKMLVLDNSSACNLYCETCRMCVDTENKSQKFRSMQITKEVIPLIKGADKILLAGNGEVFVSESYQYILNNMKKLHHNGLIWDIVSNGNLMTKDRLDCILAIGEENTRVSVSVDAANEETYQMIRRGGNWKKLMENLKYVGLQREKGKLAIFRLNFVVQSKNVREMGEFVELARRLNANEIWFTDIKNWGTYSNEEFERISIRNENGEIKTEYRKYFENPILKSKDVRISALLTSKEARIDI